MPRTSKVAAIQSVLVTTNFPGSSQQSWGAVELPTRHTALRDVWEHSVPLARRAVPGGHVSAWETPCEAVLTPCCRHSLLGTGEHYMQRSESLSWEGSLSLSPLCNILWGKCSLISSSEVNSSFCCTKLTSYFLILLCTSLFLTNWQSQHSCLL